MLKYNKENISLAKNLRKNMTPWENKLWYQFLRRYPVRFQRQKAIDEYIVDFYCAKARLVMELDGSGHFEDVQSGKDLMRTEKLRRYKLNIVRFPNNEIDKNFEGVCEYIDQIVKQSLPSSLPRGKDTSLVRER